MCFGISDEARSAELALGPSGVVDAAEAVASFWVTEVSWALGVCVPTAVTWSTNARCFVKAGAALVTLWAAILGKALVTNWRATGICKAIDRCALEPHYKIV